MRRLFRLTFLTALFAILASSAGFAELVYVSGRIAPGDVRVFLKENTYLIQQDYVVGGTLIIEPGTTIKFYPNSRIIDSTGGRIVADGMANAQYNPNPNGIIPIDPPGSSTNPLPGFSGYADLNYFLYQSGSTRTLSANTVRDLTVHPNKYNYIFNVVLDKQTRVIRDLNPATAGSLGPNEVIIPFEQAIVFVAARLGDANNDININIRPWKRVLDVAPDFSSKTITFLGQNVNNFSKEWGHIVVLPGARAAFFRNCTFDGFRKDTTVDRRDFYSSNVPGGDWPTINKQMISLTNGSGGVITTFSSRTWILGCEFKNNMARYNGGALQFIQSPAGFTAPSISALGLDYYPADKNPNITNKDGNVSSVVASHPIARIDMIDEPGTLEPITDANRQAYDDGRLAIYLGRIRNLKLDGNTSRLSNAELRNVGNPPVPYWKDILDAPATYPQAYQNTAFGGAIYIAGRAGDETKQMEIGLGINNTIKNSTGTITFPNEDTFEAIGNTANNYQGSLSSPGARGGAVYVGKYTSLIIAGKLNYNQTNARFIEVPNIGPNAGFYSLGGAVYCENTYGRLQVRGGPQRDNINNPTEFRNNKAAAGGAIYVDGNADPSMSPIIGGSDTKVATRDFGFNIVFDANTAVAFGGAIYTRRNFTINGAGGVEANSLIGYGGLYPVRFENNTAGYSGGALEINIPNSYPTLPASQRNVAIVRAVFANNTVGANLPDSLNKVQVRGGGAIYSLNGDLNLVKGVEFTSNTVYNGNGGAIAMVHPVTSSSRFFVTDLDAVQTDADGIAKSYTSNNAVFTFNLAAFPPDARMLTRFLDNKCIVDANILAAQSGTGTTQVGPNNIDVKRFHPGAIGLAENGIGLGGAIYVLDSTTINRAGRADSVNFNRVRIQNNTAFTGAAIYSDNYNLKLIFNRSLITTNTATSEIGKLQNAITGPALKDINKNIISNQASSDLASTVIYGEIQGPLPSTSSPEAANSIYDNNARFLIRLPDAPNSKSTQAGTAGIGSGGTDTLRGNYWGRTEANVNLVLPQSPDPNLPGAEQETFFIKGDNQTHLGFLFQPDPNDPRTQGPFESIGRYAYVPVPLNNGVDENTPGALSIPEQLLMSGVVYDLYDKGTDIKTADYSKRRMSPIEDFAVGLPPVIRRYNEAGDSSLPSFAKYVKRWIRDPFVAEARDDQGNLVYPMIADLQNEFQADKNGSFYHPIGYPLWLETRVNYDGLAERSNHDPRSLNETVFFVINETTGDFIRANLRQVGEDAPYREIFRTRVELVPDSSNRNPNSLFRRSTEGLANLGSGNALLSQLEDNPYREDSAALQGRKYHAASAAFGRVPDLFSNRPSMPASNNGNVTFFAGERYHALPVDTGDVVRVISRTVLWKEGVIPAYNDGIAFKVVHSTLPPDFTGNIVALQTDTIIKIQPSEYPWKRAAGIMDTLKITEFQNKIFVSEDRIYPVALGDYSGLGEEAGRDSILSVTAKDINKFYDPRSLQNKGLYPQLTYRWSVADNSALKYWLMVDTMYVEETDPNIDNPRDEAYGYLVFRGQPINPFVVPGGEDVYVSAENYPPHARTIDSLKSLTPPLSQDVLDKFVNVFTPYFSNGAYDIPNARFLQQDTINSGSNFRREYSYKLYVVDNPPKFFDNYVTKEEDLPAKDVVVKKRLNRQGQEADYFTYRAPVYTCGLTSTDPSNAKFKANLTDKLRFQADFSTDDEWEDFAVEPYWNFRYGRTAYGFMNVNIRPLDGDTVVIDSTIYDKDADGVDDNLVITQTRPSWMANQFIMQYGQEATFDPYALDFTKSGKLNIRIDGATARLLLKPTNQHHGALNVDTVFTVVVTDGHGGKTTKDVPLFINVAPEITTQTLPNAKEDFDYNPKLLDSSKMIQVFDPNFDQDHRFELIYSDDARTSIAKDPCFAEAGVWDLTGLKTTPKWLKINPISGLLYGMPGITDAPKDETVTVAVWDIIDGEIQLSAIKTYTLRVDSTNHLPKLVAAPTVKCIDAGRPYTDTLIVTDRDLLRLAPDTETLTLEVAEPIGSGLTIQPPTVTGDGTKDSVKVLITGTPTIDPNLIINGRVTIKVKVTDKAGNVYILQYRLRYSDPTDFVATVKVENVLGAYQLLEFGTAKQDATTGEGFDGEPQGTLDNNFCEFELPPVPHRDIFDARWYVSSTNGIQRNIFPTAKTGVKDIRLYKAVFQSGGESGNTSINYPITISWLRTDIPDVTDAAKNPTGASWFIRDDISQGDNFSYNMRTGIGASNPSVAQFIATGDLYKIVIRNVDLTGFVILHDWASPVSEPVAGYSVGISNITPNPLTQGTQITFGLANDSQVRIEVLDVLGNVVAIAADGFYSAGQNTIFWTANGLNGQDLSSGTYTCRMSAGSLTSTYKMVIVK